MKDHIVFFYGSARIIGGPDALTPENIRRRNILIGFERIPYRINEWELEKYGEECFNKNETGIVYPYTIVPFDYLYTNEEIISHLEDVIIANEKYIKADSIHFPLLELKHATGRGRTILGNKFKDCCFGHHYLKRLNEALNNQGYFSSIEGNLNQGVFTKADGRTINIIANAGI